MPIAIFVVFRLPFGPQFDCQLDCQLGVPIANWGVPIANWGSGLPFLDPPPFKRSRKYREKMAKNAFRGGYPLFDVFWHFFGGSNWGSNLTLFGPLFWTFFWHFSIQFFTIFWRINFWTLFIGCNFYAFITFNAFMSNIWYVDCVRMKGLMC